MALLRRRLSRPDFELMNLPLSLSLSHPDKVQGDAKARLLNYLSQIDDHIREGRGVYIHGNPGVGKSSVASIIGMVLCSMGRPVYFTSLWELVRDVKEQRTYRDDVSVLERCRTVDNLILDGVRPEDFRDKFFFDSNDIMGLLQSRTSRCLLTVLTSRLKPQEIVSEAMPDQVKELLKVTRVIPFLVEGKDLREERLKQDQNLLKGSNGSR